MREHRLYQADWLMRFYGFDRREIASTAEGGMLDLAVDPKLAWALANRGRIPVDVNRADRETLLRVPGLGVKSVDKLISPGGSAVSGSTTSAHLPVHRRGVRPSSWRRTGRPAGSRTRLTCARRLAPPPAQLSLF